MNELPTGISKVIISADKIHNRIIQLAQQIDHDYSEVDQLLLIGILRGAFIFLADLTRQLNIPHVIDFIALSSYEKDKLLSDVRVLLDSRETIRDRHVLIVEDILDSGYTLNFLYRNIIERKPASLCSCVLVKKDRDDIKLTYPVDYIGFDIPNVWVVGYGLDYDNRYRTLPYIAELIPEVQNK